MLDVVPLLLPNLKVPVAGVVDELPAPKLNGLDRCGVASVGLVLVVLAPKVGIRLEKSGTDEEEEAVAAADGGGDDGTWFLIHLYTTNA